MFGGQILPNFLQYFIDAVKIDPNISKDAQADINIPPPNVNHAFVEELGVQNISRRSFFKWERIMMSHGHTF